MAKLNKIMPPRNTTIRGQDHLLAYITPEEAQMLMDNGGSGEAGPMGIPTFIDPGAGANNAGSGATGVGPDDHDADLAGSTGAQVGGTSGFGDVLGGFISNSPFGKGVNAIGGFLDKAVGLEAHSSGAGGGTGGDGFPETSYMSRYYGGGGSSQNRCPEGYIYDEQLGACRLNTRPDDAVQENDGLLRPAPSGGYARMGLLDVSPTGLSDFAARYGLSGFASPSAFEQQNLAFRRQGATYPEFYKQQPLMPGYTNLETGAVVPPSGVPIPPTPNDLRYPTDPNAELYVSTPGPADITPPFAASAIEATPYGRIDRFTTETGELSPTAKMITDIMGLGIDDPLIQKAQETLGPSGGDPMARALTIAAQMPTPDLGFATRGQYLESLGEIGRATGRVGLRIQDDTGRTIGWSEFEPPEGGD